MEAVLARLDVGHTQEEQVRHHAVLQGVLRWLQRDLVGAVVGPPPAERLLPEGRQPVRVGRVDVDALDAQAHVLTVPRVGHEAPLVCPQERHGSLIDVHGGDLRA